jgi:uncharacterized membrane-anchored protein YitT (DUF2179 family)
MQQKRKLQWLAGKAQKMLLIAAGAVLYAAGISLFLNPNDLAPGGVTGVAILINRFTGIEAGTLILLLNIPILLLGLWKFGWKFTVSTFYALGVITLATNAIEKLGPVTDDRLLAAIVGAAMLGYAISIIFRCGATTGGIDIIVKLLRRKFPYMKTGSLFFLLDCAVVVAAGLVFGNIESSIYAGIAVMVTTYTMDLGLYGKDEARLMYIISDHTDELTKHLLKDADVGVTILHGEGAFRNKDTRIAMCVADKKKSLAVENIIKEVDPQAFLIITSANEIYGKGYKNIFAEKI